MARVYSRENVLPLLPKHGIIAVDGVDRSGKSELAKFLAEELGSTHIELDSFRWELLGVEMYTSSIDFSQLVSSIKGCVTSTIVIEGILVRDVLASAGIPYNSHVFCSKKEISLSGARYTHVFDDDIVEEFPEPLIYRQYQERHALPDSADIIFEWEEYV